MYTRNLLNLDLFITGPVAISKKVQEAALLPNFGHRDSENLKRAKPIAENLLRIAECDLLPENEYIPILFNGSGSVAMEASIRSLVADDETVLTVSVGAFGDLYHKLARTNGKKAELLSFEAGKGIQLDKLEEALFKYSPKVVTITHNETSTGVRNPLEDICKLIEKYNALALIDGVSLLGCAKTHISTTKPAIYCSATQKGLGLPAGFGIAFVHEKAFEKAKSVTNRGYSSDILAQREKALKYQSLTTPNSILLNQMFVALEEIVSTEGIENRFKRHEILRDYTLSWGKSVGLEAFAEKGFESPSLTSFSAPNSMGMSGLKEAKEKMRAKGYLFDVGYGKLNEDLVAAGKSPIFRIGHMAEVSEQALEKYLSTLAEVLFA